MPKTDYKANIAIQTVALSVGLLLLCIKFAAYFLTNSNAIFSDALESIINVVAGLFGLYSLYLANKPVDTDHPYGHGKVELLSASFEGTLIFIAGAAIIVKAIYNLFHPNSISSIDIGIYITAFAGLINYLMGWYMQRKGESSNSLTLVAGGEHLKTDAYSSVGLILGLLLIYFTNWQAADNWIAIIFGLLIIYSGINILRKSVGGIMDEADEELIGEVLEVLNKKRKTEWIDIHNLRCIRYGPRLHIDCHVTVPWYYNTIEAHEVIESVQEVIDEEAESYIEMFIHADPCQAFSCRICSLDCEKRRMGFEERLEWNVENVMKNEKHR